ncbi:MAG: hypothetical protein ACHQYP_12960, partial [Nitrospiria bacterium]
LMDMPLMWTAWIPSGFPLSRSYGQVFAIYMTKSKMIPKVGGQKFEWTKKITFHLDLEDLAQWSVFLLDPAPSKSFVFYRKGPDQKEKTVTFIKRENQQYVVKTAFGTDEIVLTLLPSDIFLLIQGMKSLLLEEMFWHGTRN